MRAGACLSPSKSPAHSLSLVAISLPKAACLTRRSFHLESLFVEGRQVRAWRSGRDQKAKVSVSPERRKCHPVAVEAEKGWGRAVGLVVVWPPAQQLVLFVSEGLLGGLHANTSGCGGFSPLGHGGSPQWGSIEGSNSSPSPVLAAPLPQVSRSLAGGRKNSA